MTAVASVERHLLYDAPYESAVDGSYIVVLREDSVDNIPVFANRIMMGLEGVSYTHEISGKAMSAFVVRVEDEGVPRSIRGVDSTRRKSSLLLPLLQYPEVLFIEQDQTVDASNLLTSIEPPSWGLDRIDQNTLPLDRSYTYSWTGAGVDAYVVDTGVLMSHEQFRGRVSCGWDYFNTSCVDVNGHGTHVAGILAGSSYGVAKDTNMIVTKVLDSKGRGQLSYLLSAIDYIADQAFSKTKAVVANLSLSGVFSFALNAAMNHAVKAGVVFVIAAGNKGRDVCLPVEINAIIVGAIDATDTRAGYSNYGPCVDVFAPGTNITSAWIENDQDSKLFTGTSMAAPHVAGVAALYIQAYPDLSALEIKEKMLQDASPGLVNDARSSVNKIINIEMLLMDPLSPPLNSSRTNKLPTGTSGNQSVPVASSAGTTGSAHELNVDSMRSHAIYTSSVWATTSIIASIILSA